MELDQHCSELSSAKSFLECRGLVKDHSETPLTTDPSFLESNSLANDQANREEFPHRYQIWAAFQKPCDYTFSMPWIYVFFQVCTFSLVPLNQRLLYEEANFPALNYFEPSFSAQFFLESQNDVFGRKIHLFQNWMFLTKALNLQYLVLEISTRTVNHGNEG